MCVKCIVDSGHSTAAALMLVNEIKSGQTAVAYLTDPANHIELTEAEHQAIVDLSQRECDWVGPIYGWIKDINDTLRPIAIAHSYPNKK